MTEDSTRGDMRAPPPMSVPSPDPTILTTQLVDRAIAAFREVMAVRFQAVDEATKLAAERTERIPIELIESRRLMALDIAHAATSLREVLEARILLVEQVAQEKFTGIDNRFLERDARVEQAAQESRISLDAALAAAKEAVAEQNKASTLAIGKSEAATQKQIDSMAELNQSSFKGMDDKVTDLRERVAAVEGRGIQVQENRNQSNWVIGAAIAAISVGIGLISLAIAVAAQSP